MGLKSLVSLINKSFIKCNQVNGKLVELIHDINI